jgi:hypothetical protein
MDPLLQKKSHDQLTASRGRYAERIVARSMGIDTQFEEMPCNGHVLGLDRYVESVHAPLR